MNTSSGLFPRLVWLLAGAVALVALIGLITMSVASSRIGDDYAEHMLALQIQAADVLIAQGQEQQLADLNVQRASTPPAARSPALRIVRSLLQDVQARWPQRDPFIAGLPLPTVWIKAQAPGNGWIGIPLLGVRRPLVRSAAVTIGFAALIILLMAGAYARSLTDPLRRLALAAPDVAAGKPLSPLPIHSVRELVELHAALSRAADDARNSARERDVMLAALSHDLRTPLARLRLGLELVGDGVDKGLREGMEADIEAIDGLSAQFIGFIRDGSDEPDAPVDLAATLRELLALNRGSGGPPWEIDAPEHAVLQGHPLALRRALDNLIRNALGHGAAPFRASLVQRTDHLEVCIADGGPGAPEAMIDQLGKPFVRGNVARSDAMGSGLGLASVKRIALQHGGALTVRNVPAGGFEARLVLRVRNEE
ncbi:ATP-binding protein [Dyella sp.]|uniref:ATP-binding protein n=1 Tax=Dyella sp. TaxID=1869338 RepID=UPI002ED20A2C